ncbi:MAG: aminopeptidase [Promethearchaeota archaeon]|jgi:aminopeptidase
MFNKFYKNLARLVVDYSIKVEKGDRILITGPAFAKELFQALYVEITKSGGHPTLLPQIEGIEELRYKYASDEQLQYVDPVQKQMIKEVDGFVIIGGDYNTHKLSLIDPKKIAKARGAPDQREMWGILMERIGNLSLKYLIVPFPCNSLAQEANMDLYSYFEFVQKALLLHEDDPIKKWSEIDKKQQEICNFLETVDNIQIIGEDTDLQLSVKGRKWINCSGRLNLPDGEVCTGPLENSANGHIRFTYPAIYQGNEVENIYLEFKDGKVIKSTAEKGEKLLKEILKLENADRVGEFAIGTNYGIREFTKNILFDEKLGGTMHLALGSGLEEAGSTNKSAIHWDIIKDMKQPGSKILADDKIIYEDGNWKI